MRLTFPIVQGRVRGPEPSSVVSLESSQEYESQNRILNIATEAMDHFRTASEECAGLDGRCDDLERSEPTPPRKPGVVDRLFGNPISRYQSRLEQYQEDHAVWQNRAIDSAQETGLVVTDERENQAGISGEMRFSPEEFNPGGSRGALATIEGLEHADFIKDYRRFQFEEEDDVKRYTILGHKGESYLQLEFDTAGGTLTVDTSELDRKRYHERVQPEASYTFDLRDARPVEPQRDQISSYVELQEWRHKHSAYQSLTKETEIINQELSSFSALDQQTNPSRDRAPEPGVVVSFADDNEIGVRGELAWTKGAGASNEEPQKLPQGLTGANLTKQRKEGIEGFESSIHSLKYEEEGQSGRFHLSRTEFDGSWQQETIGSILKTTRYALDIESELLVDQGSQTLTYSTEVEGKRLQTEQAWVGYPGERYLTEEKIIGYKFSS